MGIFGKKKEEKVIKKNDEKSEAVNAAKESENILEETGNQKSVFASAELRAGKPETKKGDSETKEAKSNKRKKISDGKKILAERVLVKPWVSEKTANMMSKGVYAFSVSAGASKNLVKDAVESLFGVTVKSINMVSVHGKLKNFKGKSAFRSDRKKAIVYLKDGQKIEELSI